jgi:hypothetical protein
MKMGASKPILGDRQTIQNIDFFNSISAHRTFDSQKYCMMHEWPVSGSCGAE